MAGRRNELLPTAFGNVETWFILEDNGTLSGVTLILNRNYILGIRGNFWISGYETKPNEYCAPGVVRKPFSSDQHLAVQYRTL